MNRRNPAIRIALLFAFFGFLWIGFSDYLLEKSISDVNVLTRFQSFKGWVFILATACLIYFIVNIEFRRILKLETALRQSEAKYRRIVDTAQEGIWIVDTGDRTSFVNDRMAAILGYEPSEMISGGFVRFFEPEHREAALKKLEACRDGMNRQYEVKLRKKDGSPLWARISSNPLYDEDGSYGGCLSLVSDVSLRKTAEKEMSKALTDKEALLREIHHRVKNNLQVISSLLNLQIGYLKDAEDEKYFLNSQLRIKSMALIHEQLYVSRNSSEIDLSSYAGDLFSLLVSAYSDVARHVAFAVEGDGVSVSIEKAVPCGLILNELILNSLKHGFPEGRTGEIRIGFRRNGELVSVSVSDNGIGFPAVPPEENLGLSLVSSLVQQLQGSLDVSHIEGTSFTITFPDNMNEESSWSGKAL